MATRAEIEAYIRQAASARGLDPDFAVRVAKGESSLNPSARLNTAREDSKGIWQLNTKNGLGVEALRRGIDPGNPNTWQAQTDFALDQAKKSWRPWTVARNLQAGRATVPGTSAATSVPLPPRRPDGAPGPPDVKQPTAAPTQGTLASIYEPFQKLAIEQKEQQVEQQLAAAQALAANPPPDAPPPPPPAMPAALPPDFASLMFPRIRRGLLADDSWGPLS